MADILSGVGKVDITPPLGVDLTGYGMYLNRKAREVHDHLYARVLILRWDGSETVLVNSDLLGLSRETIEESRKLISEDLGVDEDSIILTATHTHSGPATTFMRGLGEVNPDYVSSLPERFLEGSRLAAGNIKPVEVGFNSSYIGDVSFNRVVKDGPIDPEVAVLTFKVKGGGCLATLFNFSCHPVTVDVRTEGGLSISADWPGYAMRMVEERIGGTAFFLQGTCGDIDPIGCWGMRSFDLAEEIGGRVFEKVVEAYERTSYMKNPVMNIVGSHIKLPLQNLTLEDILKDLLGAIKQQEEDDLPLEKVKSNLRFYREWAADMMEKISRGLPSYIEAEVHVLRIGDAAVTFLPGEVFVEIGLKIKERSPFKDNMVVGYSGPYVGYIPTSGDYEGEGYSGFGGYAANTAPKMFGYPPFTPDVGDVLLEHSLRLLEEAYRLEGR